MSSRLPLARVTDGEVEVMLTRTRSPTEAPNVLEGVGLGVLAEVTLRVEFKGLRVEFGVMNNRPKQLVTSC